MTGLTVIWGLMVLLFLPDSPMRAKVSTAVVSADNRCGTTTLRRSF